MVEQRASVSVRGTPENPIFDFWLPTGPKGEPGGWNVGTSLGSKDLNMVTTPGLYYQGDQNVPKNAALNYPPMADWNGSIRGMLEVKSWSGGVSIIQEYSTIGIRGTTAPKPSISWRRHNNGTEWGIWYAYGPQIIATDANGFKMFNTYDPSTNTEVTTSGPGGWAQGVDLGAANLDTVTTPGLYRQTSGPAITLAANYPKAALVGTLAVEVRIPAGQPYGPSVTQTFTPYFGSPDAESRMFYKRTLTGGLWQPWRVYTSQRVDNTAGRAIYTWDDTQNREQLIYGDTGWRTSNTPTLQQPVWNTSTLRLRRVGNVVDFIFLGSAGPRDTSLNGTDIQAFRVIHVDDIPSAFRPNTNTYHMGFGRFSQSSGPATPRQYVMCVMNASGGMHFEKDETAPNGVLLGPTSSLFVSGSYTTTSAWPSSLPGQ